MCDWDFGIFFLLFSEGSGQAQEFQEPESGIDISTI